MATASTAPAGAHVQNLVHPKAEIVAQTHSVTIGHGTVVHPYAMIQATNGPIVIGDYCVLDEACMVENKLPPDPKTGRPTPLVVGNYVMLGCRCDVLAASIGNGCRIDAAAYVGTGAVLEDGVTVKPKCRVNVEALVPAGTVVYGADSSWRQDARDVDGEQHFAMNCSRYLRRNMTV
jgi:carbonic anhydrase/acetyltransferase-like protein (isoleucine patch superfamily)